MEGFGENVKKLLLAGVGAIATTTEKSKELLDEMVKKGELTVEQGKILNEELKHNIKNTIKETKKNGEEVVNEEMEDISPEEFENLLKKMTAEQMDELKEKIHEYEMKQEDERE